MTLNDSQDAATSGDALPAPIKTYLTEHAGRESAKVLSAFTADAVVTDEGRGPSTSCNTWKGTFPAGSPTFTSDLPWTAH
jgi:hypothetical protein